MVNVYTYGVACVLVLSCALGCSPTLIKNSPVEATQENLAVWDKVEEYRLSMEERDVDRLMNLVSREYFDNFATTDKNEDDYGYESLRLRLAPVLRNNAKKVRVSLRLTGLKIENNRAEVQFEYTARFLISEGGRDSWESRNDFNRLVFARENDDWKIVEGL